MLLSSLYTKVLSISLYYPCLSTRAVLPPILPCFTLCSPYASVTDCLLGSETLPFPPRKPNTHYRRVCCCFFASRYALLLCCFSCFCFFVSRYALLFCCLHLSLFSSTMRLFHTPQSSLLFLHIPVVRNNYMHSIDKRARAVRI